MGSKRPHRERKEEFMARKRMFSLDICNTDKFLEMPSSTQALYFHLGLRADDDGFVANPNGIIKLVGSSIDDIKILMAKELIIPMGSSGVFVISHWKVNNTIRADRYTPSPYSYMLDMLTEMSDKSYKPKPELINGTVDNMTTNMLPQKNENPEKSTVVEKEEK